MKRIPSKSPTKPFPDGPYFRAIAEYGYDWESWHGEDGQLVWVNPAVERVTGRSVDECLAMSDYPLQMIAHEDRETVVEVLNDARRRASGNDAEFRVVHQSGEVKWMAISWQPMYDEQRHYMGFRTSVRDITERRNMRDQIRLHAEHLEQLVQERTARIQQLEEHRRQMEKLAALGQLAVGVAHEVNNPLAGIRNAFSLIKAELSPDHEHYDLIDLIDREIERIALIVHQMYQLYRRTPQPPKEFDMPRSANEVVRLLASTASKKEISTNVEESGASTKVCLPEGEVKQVLYNLVRNAIEASPKSSAVSVRVVGGENEVQVSIRDEGAGIPEDVLPRIFDPFFSTKRTGPESGMGLGLSVSQSLMESLGGRIEVDASGARGSVFTAFFPAALPPRNGGDHD